MKRNGEFQGLREFLNSEDNKCRFCRRITPLVENVKYKNYIIVFYYEQDGNTIFFTRAKKNIIIIAAKIARYFIKSPKKATR